MKATAFSPSILLATSSLAFGTAKLVGAHRGRADVQRFGFAYPAYGSSAPPRWPPAPACCGGRWAPPRPRRSAWSVELAVRPAAPHEHGAPTRAGLGPV
jgi:hypothetical protein